MVRALGYSQNDFDPTRPGRLCRGRERWIEPFEDEESDEIYRLVVSGAEFTDDTASDARRGLNHAGIDVANLIATLFPRKKLIAFMEDGHPADIPEDALGVELYTGHRAGGRSEELMVRWYKVVSGLRELRAVLGDTPETPKVKGFAWLHSEVELDEELGEQIFSLVGMSSLDSPPSQYQPSVMPDLLDNTFRALLLLHRDKHGPALGVYARQPIEKAETWLQNLCQKNDILLVTFAIPPMLARWDRALYELRTEWEAEKEEPFPVPKGPEDQRWETRRHTVGRGRRGRGRRKDREEESSEPAEAEANDAPEVVETPESVSPEPSGSEAPVDDFDLDDALFVEEP